MSLENFIPSVWIGNIFFTLRKRLVYASVSNRSYEGAISGFGSRVKLNQVGDVAVSTYTKNSTTITPQELTDAQRELVIDQSNYFAFKVDDIDAAQANVEFMESVTDQSAYALRDTSDQTLAALYAQAGIARNTDAVPVDMTSANVEQEFLELGELMTENNIQQENRFAIIPPWVHTKLVLAGIANISDNVELYRNGSVGFALGFDFRVSNNVSKNSSSWDKSRIIAGVIGQSLGYAEQIVTIEAYRPEDSFSDAVKGLMVHGAKVVRPDMTAVLYADKTAEA